MAKGNKITGLLFKLNHTMPKTDEYFAVLKEIFGDNIGTDTCIAALLNGAVIDRMKIGNHVFINSNLLAMAR